MVMTGMLCIIGQGTTVQPMVATFIQFCYLLVVLKLAPYISDSDDWASIINSMSIVLTLQCGFALMTDSTDDPQYNKTLMDVLITSLVIGSVLIQLGIIVLFKCGIWKKIKKRGGGNSSKVVPVTTNEKEVDGAAVKTWR